MATTFAQARDILTWMIDDKGTTTKERLRLFLNKGAEDVARASDWAELIRRDYVVLGAPYSTGTVAATVNSATLTGTGTAWNSQTPALDKQYKFALDYRSPHYALSSIGSDTAITLADNYIEATNATAAYVLYKDVVSMPSDCNKVYEVWVHDDGERYQLRFIPERWHYPLQTETPCDYTIIERDSSNNMQIQVGPYAPDKAYRLEVVYRADVTADKLAGDSGTKIVLDDDKLDIVLQRALYWATKRDKERAEKELGIYNVLLADTLDGNVEGATEPVRLREQTRYRRLEPTENWRDLEI